MSIRCGVGELAVRNEISYVDAFRLLEYCRRC